VDHLGQGILSHRHYRNSNLLRYEYIPENMSKGSNRNVAIKKLKINCNAQK
jgi:hypothetical protein